MTSFTIVFNSLATCADTTLQQGIPFEPTLSQSIRETNIIQRDLVQPTNTYAESVGDASACGPLAYEILYVSNYQPVPFMYLDTTALKYWADIQDERQQIGLIDLAIKIKLQDYPAVAPVIVILQVDIQCPSVHIRVETLSDSSFQQNVMYDVAVAGPQTYRLPLFEILPPTCFTATYTLLDVTGVDTSSFTYATLSSISYDPLIPNEFVLDKAGTQEFTWIENPFSLHLQL